MSQLNTIYYNDPNRQLVVNNNTNELVISGYRLILDQTLNRDVNLVSSPVSTTSPGTKGSLAFDKQYVYYCIDQNTWARSPLSSWSTSEIRSTYSVKNMSSLPQASNWWNFTTNSNATYGDYNFTSIGPNTFSSSGAYVAGGTSSLVNYSSNLVEPATLNQNFSISFETKRLNINNASNSQFLLGSPFGQLGFHFEYTNSNYTNTGDYLTFSFSTHTPSTYSWTRVRSLSPITDTGYHQIVGVNNAFNKAITLYIDGILQGSGKYTAPGSKFFGSAYKGFGIGASPNGSNGTPVASTEYNTKTIIRNCGFWKNYSLTSGDASNLYNTGSFRVFPFN